MKETKKTVAICIFEMIFFTKSRMGPRIFFLLALFVMAGFGGVIEALPLDDGLDTFFYLY